MISRMRTLAGLIAFASAAVVLAAPTLNVGSKRFTESYILGEILKQTAHSAGETSAILGSDHPPMAASGASQFLELRSFAGRLRR